MKRALVTGATGFVGSHVVTRMREENGWLVTLLTRSNKVIPQGEDIVLFKRLYHDLGVPFLDRHVVELQDVRVIVHLGADVSGVTSLLHPVKTVTTNVLGTYHLLELARLLPNLEKFIYVSTGEVLGHVELPYMLAEDAPLNPSNPYAASKAAGEELCRAYRLSFGVPTVIVRSMNLFGEYQSPSRFVPMVIRDICGERKITCHVGDNGQSGSRNWLHVTDFSTDILQIIERGSVGETYHVVGPERTNIDIINLLGLIIGLKPNVHLARPGASHDMRYALRDTKLGLCHDLEPNLTHTTLWYAKNPEYLR